MGPSMSACRLVFATTLLLARLARAEEPQAPASPAPSPTPDASPDEGPNGPDAGSDEPQVPDDDAFLDEIPITVGRVGGNLVFTLTEAWLEAELAVGGCTSVSMNYGPTKAGKILSFKADPKKACSVELSWARPDLSGVMLSFEIDGEKMR
jgi:hypothetical protein